MGDFYEGPDEVSKRFKSLSLDKIDKEYFERTVTDAWNRGQQGRDEALRRREEYMRQWRDLVGRPSEGPWEKSANFHVPLILTHGKAIHARLWQIFGNTGGLYAVEARKEVYTDKENQVKEFMDWVLDSWANSKSGTKEQFDEWLWNVVFDGSGYLKLYWQREVHQFLDIVPVLEETKETVFDRLNLTGTTNLTQTVKEEEQLREEILESPQIRPVNLEDILLPEGHSDPQTAPFVIQLCSASEDYMKALARDGKWDEDAVEEVLQRKESSAGLSGADRAADYKESLAEVDGFDSKNWFDDDGNHYFYEWYGKLYVDRTVDEDTEQDLSKFPQEVVCWVHKGTGKLLGWTYLYRTSPAGIRPIFKADFLHFSNRNTGVGVPEVLSETSTSVDALYNLRVNNGTLSSIPWGVYRASSGLKPDIKRVKPGHVMPVDDVNDIRMMQFPFLQGFGQQEEGALRNDAERLLAAGDIQMGLAPQKVGALRNATGSNLIASESNIQLEIHFDRLARCLNKLLQATFQMCRLRMPETLYYRVTGDKGEPIFGKVNRSNLVGEFDFSIKVDLLGQSRLEQQQQATMVMQTLISPAFMQTGVVQPTNQYNMAANYLRANKITRIADYITEPAGYTGPVITPEERIYRISIGRFMDPPIESTVQLQENHEKALAAYEGFKNSDYYGMLTMPEQMQALERLIEATQSMLQAQQSGGSPNMSGMQIPRDGYQGVGAQIGGGGEALQAQAMAQGVGTPNGPVV